MKIKALKQMLVNGNEVVAGDVVEVSDFDGNYLTCRGFAEPVVEEPVVEEPEKPAPKKAKAKK